MYSVMDQVIQELSLTMKFWATENAALSKTEPCSPSEQLLSFSAQQTVKKKTKVSIIKINTSKEQLDVGLHPIVPFLLNET